MEIILGKLCTLENIYVPYTEGCAVERSNRWNTLKLVKFFDDMDKKTSTIARLDTSYSLINYIHVLD